MTLHPEIAKVLASLPPRPAGPPDPLALRAEEEEAVAKVARDPVLQRVEESVVPTDSGDVPIRIYTPTHATSYGVIVYLHGGAFFLGSLNTHDHVARSLAAVTGCKVVAVGYRLAPEHRFPAGLEDCRAVVDWVARGAAPVAWNHGTLALVGDSSGANFVAAIAAMARDDGHSPVTHQVLYYPSLDLDFDPGRYPSLRDNAEGYGLETAGLKPFNAFYLSSGADPDDPRVSPIKRSDLTGLPPALILTGELDPLRDEGELYGLRLQEAGVRATVSRYAGAGHGFVQHFSWLPEYHRAFEETMEFLR